MARTASSSSTINVSSSIGGGGGGLGYQGIGASAGVEFDTWNNGNDGSTINDSDSNHLGIDTNGSVFSLAQIPVAPNFDNGALWTAWIDYDGTNLEVRTNTTGVRPVGANLSLALNIPALLGGSTAFVGFSAGTGADFANHDILSWTYSDEFKPGGVDPGAIGPRTRNAVPAGNRWHGPRSTTRPRSRAITQFITPLGPPWAERRCFRFFLPTTLFPSKPETLQRRRSPTPCRRATAEGDPH